MKALRLEAPCHFSYTDISEPDIQEDEVLVRVKACAICGSDIHGCDGKNGRRIPPIIMGHEASGIIEKAGAKVTHFVHGDRVTFDSTEYCSTCWFCMHGYHNLCGSRRILGVSTDTYKKDGAMAEYIAVKARTLYRIPAEVSFEEACLAEPLAVGMHAVRLSEVREGQNVAVIGAGTIGLMTLLAVRSKNPAHVVVSGRHAYRQQAAYAMGASDVVGDEGDELDKTGRFYTHGRGMDIVYDTVGTEKTFKTALKVVRNGGKIICVGNCDKEIAFPLQECIVRQISIICSYSQEGEFAECLARIADGSINLEYFTRNTIPLSEGAAAFERLRKKESDLLKVIIVI